MLDNDFLSGQPVSPDQVSVTPVTQGPLTVNADGTITVAPNTPAGTYTVTYTICEILNPTNCASATVTVEVVVDPEGLVANPDLVGPVNGVEGLPNAGNVLDNDTFNGQPVTAEDVNVTPVTEGPVTIGTDGTITVAPNTPAGTYTIDYTICLVSDPSQCATGTVTVEVTAAGLVANPDVFGPFTGNDGIENAGNVLDNDFLNGQPISPEDVNLTPVTQGPLTVNADGTVTLAPNTPAGTYTVTYTICEILNPSNCAIATVTIEVREDAPILIANPDNIDLVNGLEGTDNAGNVLDNDLLNGQPVTPEDVNVIPVTEGPITIGTDGTVSVAPNTPAGTYTVTYTVCDANNPGNCATGTVTIEVAAATLVANPDFFGPFSSADGIENGGNVLDNDFLSGQPVSPDQVSVTPVTQGPLTVNADGTITVAPNTPAGTYTVTYTICEILNPTNCASATVTVEVVVDPEGLVANPDLVGPVNGVEGLPNAGNVLDNDTFNGQPVTAEDVNVTPVTEGPVTIGTDGTITVAPNTPAGTYTIDYTICLVSDPSQCATGTVTVEIVPLGPVASISITNTADRDVFTTVGEEIGYSYTVTNSGDVTLTDVTVTDPLTGLTVQVGTLLPGQSVTLDGTYTVSQSDLDRGFIDNIATATGTAPDGTTVTDTGTEQVLALLDLIVNNDSIEDIFGSNGSKGILNIFANDSLNGKPITPEDVILTQVGESEYLILNPDGSIDLKPNTPAGTYELVYQICDIANPGNCGTATVTVIVNTPLIIANDDDFGTIGLSFGGTLGYIIANDLLNGLAIDPSLVDFEFIDLGGIQGLIIGDDGELILIPGLNPPGTYILQYRVCEILNPTNCDTAFVIITILPDVVDLSVSKTSFDVEVYEGDEFEYEITVRNLTGTTASEVVVSDDLPQGLTYISSTIVENSSNVIITSAVQANLITWTIPSLPGNSIFTIRLRVSANSLTLGTEEEAITNLVTVVSSEEDINPEDNNATDFNSVKAFFIPNVITPNDDGVNDVLRVKGLKKYIQNRIVIFNRWGDHLYESENYQNNWGAEGLVAGTYYYILWTQDESGAEKEYKGWIQVIRK